MSGIADYTVFPDSIIKKIAQGTFELIRNDATIAGCFGPNIYLLEGGQLPPNTAANQLYINPVVKQIKWFAAEKVQVFADIIVGLTIDNEQTMTAVESPMNGVNFFFYLMTLLTSDASDTITSGGKQLNVPCNELSMDWAPLPKEVGYRFLRCHILMQTFIDPTTGNLIYGG